MLILACAEFIVWNGQRIDCLGKTTAQNTRKTGDRENETMLFLLRQASAFERGGKRSLGLGRLGLFMGLLGVG